MWKEEIDPTIRVFYEYQYKCEGKKKENGETSCVILNGKSYKRLWTLCSYQKRNCKMANANLKVVN
jgi:hypothetical protein